MKKADYMKLYDSDLDNIVLTNDDVKEWLDAAVDKMIAAKEAMYDLCYGELNEEEGEYENEIVLCNPFDEFTRLHLYKGIRKLAAAVGCEVSVKYHTNEYPHCHYFMYRGIEVFQLESTEGVK